MHSIIWDAARLRAETSRCVKCGLCLAECPTYRLHRDEAHSPRGRIALTEALASGGVGADRTAQELLSSCLLCRRCERVCPSGVAFGAILDEGRRHTRNRLPWRVRLVTAALSRPAIARGLSRGAGLAGRFLPSSTLGGRLGKRALHDAPTAGLHPAIGERRGRVGLFVGCTGALLDGEALAAAVRLLTAAGYEVLVPAGQGCCGALERHAGNPRRAARLEARNRAAFDRAGLDAVVGVSSGCGAQLAGQPGFHYRDVNRFLVESGALRQLSFRVLPGRVALHTPCTLENVLGDSDAVRALLRAIPGLELVEVGRAGGCCGAGGLAFLEHPAQSRRIGEPLAREIRALAPRYLVTANAGCGLHLEGLAPGPEYLHPVSLLARQLKGGRMKMSNGGNEWMMKR